ncbi:MAG: efflux RND transporter permease subunit [Candidatus Gracilibacteria bacterium]|nr:efflux RND transporter permease subunit [Candidatus Gracilibacteria bacterium]
MFSKIAEFFIKNVKLTFVLIIVILLSGVGSYTIISKQYNPTIIVPAFQVYVQAPGLNSSDTKKLITDELENKIMEIEGIDEVFSSSNENYVGVMVKFKVGIDKEKAKIRLLQKLDQNLDLKPIGVSDPIIKAIDPDELPQITYAITYKNNNKNLLNTQERYIYLRQIANIIKQELKTIKDITTMEIVGGINGNLYIELDLDKLKAKNVDLLQVYEALKKNDISIPVGNIKNNNENTQIEIKSSYNNAEKLKKLIVSDINGNTIFLDEIANIKIGQKKLNNISLYSDKTQLGTESVFIGVGKQVGSNSVFVTKDIESKVEELKEKLPKDIEIKEIQNEGEKAEIATNELIRDLILSIVIVIIILIAFLGVKNALNTATSIPLILSLVFLFAYLVGDNINRITLFALILIIGMLVDDSIVVVENMHRHLEERKENKKTKLEAILNAVNEVGPGVILSTITKVLSFAGMFAVTGMMGEYMGPIPKYGIVSLLLSIIIAFSINPFVTYLTTKDIEEDKHKEKKSGKFDIRKIYLKVMKYFINTDKKSNKRRKTFKRLFWISLILVIALPIGTGIFKARMLPKSNQDQIYLWIDGARGNNIYKMTEIEKDIEKFLINNKNLPKDLQVTKSISSTIGEALPADFANLFRGGSNRVGEYQLSSRINLITKEENKNRLKSENITIKLRPLLETYLKGKYNDIKIRLLEDPPGPPVRATFLMKISGDNLNEKELDNFTKKVYRVIGEISTKYDIVDLGNSLSTTYKKLEIVIDNFSLNKSGISIDQVANTLQIATNGIPINVIKDSNSIEQTNIILGVDNNQTDTIKLFDDIIFTNKLGEQIPLSSISSKKYTFLSHEINTDNREVTNYIYGEMGNNSVIYPIIDIYKILGSDSFLGNDYKITNKNFYELNFTSLKDGKKYKIEWDGEWKLTMDTFKDLGTAMIIALLAIYFLIVGQFKSFKVAGIIMLPFLLGFFGIFPGFSILYIIKNEYFNATGMIGVISLAGIVVGNAILLIDYIGILKERGWTLEMAIIEAGYIRFMPIMLTSISAIFGAIKITSDPVWSGLARSIVCGLSASAILTLIAIPIFYYESQKDNWEKDITNKLTT